MGAKKPFLQLRYKFRGFQQSEDRHNWERFPWAWCFGAERRGPAALRKGNCPLHSPNLKIRPTNFKYAEVVLDNEGTYVFVSTEEIDAISNKRSVTHYFRPRRNQDKASMADEFIGIVKELREPVEVDDLVKYGFELRPAGSA